MTLTEPGVQKGRIKKRLHGLFFIVVTCLASLVDLRLLAIVL